MDDNDANYIPSTEALAFMDEVEALEAKFKPLPHDFYYRRGGEESRRRRRERSK
jgi:hypothetical protein